MALKIYILKQQRCKFHKRLKVSQQGLLTQINHFAILEGQQNEIHQKHQTINRNSPNQTDGQNQFPPYSK